MRRWLTLGLALAGVLVAASIGYAAYLASRDSVGLPVTKLQTTPRNLAPKATPKPKARTVPRRTTTRATVTTRATTVDDHGGRSGGSGGSGSSGSSSGGSGSGGSGSSGSGSGGHGGGDD
jgi:uncharacterized membrane protein YgcG